MAEQKVAVCTGSGRHGGLGEAILSRLGQEGYRLVVTDIDGSGEHHLANPTEMDSVAQALRDQGAEVLCVPCDVRSAESVTHLFDTVIQTFGRVDALVNNAGIGFVMKHTRDVAPQEWQLVIDVTLSGVFLCTQAAAQHMEAARTRWAHYQYCQSGGEIGISAYGAVLRGKAWGHWPDTNCRHRLWRCRHHGQCYLSKPCHHRIRECAKRLFLRIQGHDRGGLFRGNGSANTASTHRTGRGYRSNVCLPCVRRCQLHHWRSDQCQWRRGDALGLGFLLPHRTISRGQRCR